MSEMRLVRDLVPGDVIDMEPTGYLHGGDLMYAEEEYVVVESINGGWADRMAGKGEVVLYSTESLSEPVVLPGDTEVSWIENADVADLAAEAIEQEEQNRAR